MATKNLTKTPPARKTQQQPAIPILLDHTGHLAAGRLKAEGEPTPHIDSINYLLGRSQALVEIIKEACDSKSQCELPKEYLVSVMDILREDAAVAQRIADELDHLYREVVPAKAD